jgi:sugar phosphate isomerase/epimerase
MPLVMWAGCAIAHPLLARTHAAQAGGFVSMTAVCADLVAVERGGRGSLQRLATELRGREVTIEVIDPFVAWYPGWEPGDDDGPHAESLNVNEDQLFRYADVLAARSVTLLSPFRGEPAPVAAVVDALGEFADRAAARGLRVHLEVIPTSMVPDLAVGWEIIRQVDRSNAGLVLDTFHLARGNCEPALLEQIPADKVFHVQLSDGSLTPRVADYFEEAVTVRDLPGEGELPIAELVAPLLRRGAPAVGPEVFSPRLEALPATDAGRVCAETTRRFLASL